MKIVLNEQDIRKLIALAAQEGWFNKEGKRVYGNPCETDVTLKTKSTSSDLMLEDDTVIAEVVLGELP